MATPRAATAAASGPAAVRGGGTLLLLVARAGTTDRAGVVDLHIHQHRRLLLEQTRQRDRVHGYVAAPSPSSSFLRAGLKMALYRTSPNVHEDTAQLVMKVPPVDGQRNIHVALEKHTS